MNIINKLTLKHMSLNRKRTLVTITGIIISVAMFTAVTTFASSFLKMMQIESSEYLGKWQVAYAKVPNDNLKLLIEDSNTKNLVTLYDIDTTVLNKDNPVTPDTSFLSIYALNSHSYNNNIKLIDGKYPTNDSQLVISKKVLIQAKMDYKVGDTITIYGGFAKQFNQVIQQEAITNATNIKPHTYTITGIIEDSYLEDNLIGQFHCFTYATPSLINASVSTSVFVELNKVTNDLYDDSKNLAQKVGIEPSNVYYNSNLYYYGVSGNVEFLNVLNTIVIVIMAIIMIGSIALIYNAFAISLAERSKYLGMISSIGATKNQKRQSVFFEGLILGIVSIPLGVIFGIGGLALTFNVINPMIKNMGASNGFPLTISFEGIIMAVVFSIITIIISTYIPARRASKITPIDAIKSTNDIKINLKTVKTSFLTKKIFGFEGELASKNLKRNKSRFRITVISLTVSVILFLSVSGFTYYFKNSFVMGNQQINFDAVVNVFDNQDLINELKNVNNASEVALTKSISLTTAVPKDFLNKDVLNFIDNDSLENNLDENNNIYLFLNIISYDNDYFTKYAKDNNLDLKNTVITTKYNNLLYNHKFKEAQILNYQNGDSLAFDISDSNNNITKFNFGKLIYDKNLPMGVFQQREFNYLNLFINDETFKQLQDTVASTVDTKIYFRTNNNTALDQEITKIMEKYPDSGSYSNIIKQVESVDQMLLIINIFIYGFIILISLISIANIFNTITTSVALRTKEFSMLKSVGMTPKSFNKMIYFESLFYGLNTLLFGLPIGFGIMFYMHSIMSSVFNDKFSVPINSFIIVIIAVFLIVSCTLLFSTNKIKKQNIIDGLKDDNI